MSMSTPPSLKIAKMAFVTVYLVLLLWWVLARPEIGIVNRWVPKTYFRSKKEQMTHTSIYFSTITFVEATFFSLVALPGYWYGAGGIGECNLIPTITYAGESTSILRYRYHLPAIKGIYQKYAWMLIVPWIITFLRGYLSNLTHLFRLLHTTSEAVNFYETILFLMGVIFIQSALASEVFFMAKQGWIDMKNVNNENVELERKKKLLNSETADIVFG